jgi:hypothetical protein
LPEKHLPSGAFRLDHRGVRWSFTAEKLEPAPIVDREEELRAELRETEVALSQLDGEMKDFRRANCIRTDRFNRIVGAQSDSMTGKAGLERTWRGYNARVNLLLPKRAALLQEIALLTVKGYTKEVNR